MNDEIFYKEILFKIRNNKIISLLILIVCLSVASVFAYSRPTIYQSELTFKVKMNQPMKTPSEKAYRLQEISQIAISEEVRKPISGDGLQGE